MWMYLGTTFGHVPWNINLQMPRSNIGRGGAGNGYPGTKEVRRSCVECCTDNFPKKKDILPFKIEQIKLKLEKPSLHLRTHLLFSLHANN